MDYFTTLYIFTDYSSVELETKRNNYT